MRKDLDTLPTRAPMRPRHGRRIEARQDRDARRSAYAEREVR